MIAIQKIGHRVNLDEFSQIECTFLTRTQIKTQVITRAPAESFLVPFCPLPHAKGNQSPICYSIN